jgi:hypothetical protein
MQTLDPPFVSALAALGAAALMVYAGVGEMQPLTAHASAAHRNARSAAHGS